MIVLAVLADLIGIGLGIAAVVQKGTSKTFGILGLIFCGLILLGFCAFGIFLELMFYSFYGEWFKGCTSVIIHS